MVQLAQLFAYGRLELYRGSSSLYTLTGGSLIEPFRGLTEDYERICAAGGMASVLLKVIQEDLPDVETLRLFLNSLHFISAGKRTPDFTRCVFLLKLIQYQGIAPEPHEIELLWNRKFSEGAKAALEHLFPRRRKRFSHSGCRRTYWPSWRESPRCFPMK